MITLLFSAEFHVTLQGSQLVKTNQPPTILCRVSCSINLNGCDLRPDWFVRAKSDGYQYHSIIRDNREEVVNELMFSTTVTGESRITCEKYGTGTEATFAINFTSIGSHDELFVTGALRKSHSNSHLFLQDPQWIVLRKCKKLHSRLCLKFVQHTFNHVADIPKVFSQQIDESGPALVIDEGDSATITCEKPANETTQLYWILGLLQNKTKVFDNTTEAVVLGNGMTLYITQSRNALHDDLEAFSIILFNLTTEFSGLTVRCGVHSEEENISQDHDKAVVIAVIPHPPKESCKYYIVHDY